MNDELVEEGPKRRRGSGRDVDSEFGRELAGRAQAVLEGLLERMGLSARAEVQHNAEQVVLDIVGDDAAQLVGKRGQVLDAIQLIVGKIVNRDVGEGLPMMIDADGYRARRADSLAKLALRLRDEAINSGRIVALNPMSARDRRIIHMTLRDEAGVSTRSEGEGDDRRLLIVPDRPPPSSP